MRARKTSSSVLRLTSELSGWMGVDLVQGAVAVFRSDHDPVGQRLDARADAGQLVGDVAVLRLEAELHHFARDVAGDQLAW